MAFYMEDISHFDWETLLNSFAQKPYFYCLESTDHSSNAEFSFMGFNPIEVCENISIDDLRKKIEFYAKGRGKSPVPFAGGAVGFFGYESAKQLEDFSFLKPSSEFFQSHFAIYDTTFIKDHKAGKIWYLNWSDIPFDPPKELGVFQPLFLHNKIASDKQCYLEAINTLKKHIYDGDIYQANLSQRFEAEFSGNPFHIYTKLRQFSPSPFSAYLQLKDSFIASVSPERFFQVRGRLVQSQPIKGTRPRGTTEVDDALQKNELLLSEKDKAELLMIVDLVRHDLGRVCELGSIQVDPLREIATYAQVHHAFSTIHGILRSDQTGFDVFKALFPGGSITGAPKIKAMQILSEIESVPRHVYTGAIGYIGFNGDCDFNIAIRTLYGKNGRCFWHAGGGIVSDSDPQKEYEESLIKARSISGIFDS